MERIMVIMIALVAIVAVGGLLYVGVHKAPQIPVFVQGPMIQPDSEMPSVSTEPGQIKFSVANPSDSTTGQVKFNLKSYAR